MIAYRTNLRTTAVPAHRNLLGRIEGALRRHDISATRFGIDAVADPKMVGHIRRGRTPRDHVQARIIAHIAKLDGEARA
ncbi:hypothetical protein [Sphingomonas sanxanigenens]|uniref:Uncharacterized protein n=1 Tax=Sphingomonas sanxanigenens DSM 19645 = NX02 TaxID=1123269 RepID=W0A4C7_9SPHN|nr:hypothetical protein [Sphingomonas sanxanigenens]AHE52814.1 hypothetical protein NX02_05375 [Sphingomonas sanxanigenens DSM 19645 = NX02]